MKISTFLSSLLIAGLICFVFVDRNILYAPEVLNYEANHRANPFQKDFYEAAYGFPKKKLDIKQARVFVGIVPHHLLAADMIANFYDNLAGNNFDTIVLIGPNHFFAGQAKIISTSYNWKTPYGELKIDDELLDELKKAQIGLAVEPGIFSSEHAITSQAAFIKKTFPQVEFLPIILHPNINAGQAAAIAGAINSAGIDKRILLLASLDFAHYMDSLSASKHDKISIETISNLNFDQVYKLEVDSPPTLYTIMKFAEMRDANFYLLDNSNSAILAGKADISEVTSYITGYFIDKINYNALPAKLDNNNIKMLFFGDLMLDRYVKEKIDINNLDYLFTKIDADFFQPFDLVGANLEGAVTNGGLHYDPVKDYDFAFQPELIRGLKKYNFNFFNIANNHIDDQGAIGIKETRANLDNLNIDYAGCPNTILDDCSSKIIQIKDTKIDMVGLNALWRSLDSDKINQMLSDIKKQANLIIVNIHWGEEYAGSSNYAQQQLAHQLIDAGADIIIGHHPHVVQEIELYKGKYIFYSLGNFIFDQYFSKETQEGLALRIELEDRKISFELLPFKLPGSQVEFILDGEKLNWLNNIAEKSSAPDEIINKIKIGKF